MRQRLGIARALLNDPAVVFLDEPTLGLDPAGQEQVLRVVRSISRERAATVLLSTHLLGEVEEVCSRVLILNRGRLVADGTVAEVARRAAAPRRGRFRVPPEARDGAVHALSGVPAFGGVRPDDGRAGWLLVDAADVDVQRAAAALTAAGIPLLAFELEGARLSDAYLAMTGGER
jgi:ABC-2 type transport system ATP-binding protein